MCLQCSEASSHVVAADESVLLPGDNAKAYLDGYLMVSFASSNWMLRIFLEPILRCAARQQVSLCPLLFILFSDYVV